MRKRFIFWEAAGSRWATTTASVPDGTLSRIVSGAPARESIAAATPPSRTIATITTAMTTAVGPLRVRSGGAGGMDAVAGVALSGSGAGEAAASGAVGSSGRVGSLIVPRVSVGWSRA
jgi:hypothetical protein